MCNDGIQSTCSLTNIFRDKTTEKTTKIAEIAKYIHIKTNVNYCHLNEEQNESGLL